MALLALGLDTGQMKTGGDQANRTLDQLRDRFAQTEARSNALSAHLQGSGKEFAKASREAGQYAQAQARLSRVTGDYAGAIDILKAHLKTLSASSVEYVRIQTQIAQVQAQADRALRGQNLAGFATGVKNINTGLSGLPGPLGNVAGRVEQLGGQLNSLVGTFGLVGAGAIALAAGLVAAGAAFVGLSIKGAKAADALLDVSESTGLTIDQVQRLGAAMERSGESVSGVESAYRQFQQTVQAAIDDPTSKAAQNLRRLGVVATEAGKDTGKAFTNTILQLGALRTSTEGAVASNETFGRNIGALTRSQGELNKFFTLGSDKLQEMGLMASDVALGSAADLDKSMNRLSQSFGTFTVNLNAVSGSNISGFFNTLSAALEKTNGWLTKNTIDIGLFYSTIRAKPPVPATPKDTGITAGPFGNIIGLVDPPISEPRKRTTTGAAQKAEPPIELAATFGDLEKANRKAKEFFEGSTRVAEAFYSTQITNFEQYTRSMTEIDAGFREAQLSNARQIQTQLEQQLSGLKPGTDAFNKVNTELSKVKVEVTELARQIDIVVLPQIDKFIERLKDFGKISLPLGPVPDLSGGSTRPRTVTGIGVPHPDDIGRPDAPATRPRIVNEQRVQDRERLKENFGNVFEDFIFQIVSARKGLKEAFGDLLLGIVDSFAASFAASLRKSFIDPIVSRLTDMLSGALDKLFNALKPALSGLVQALGGFFGDLFKGGGFNKIFGTLAKVFGALLGGGFGGGFAMGGTIAPNSWGIVGEHGRELAFSGNQPLHVVPQGAMGGGGSTFQFNFNVTASGGQVDRRSMDQMADTVYQAVTRAQRNKGA